MPLHEHHSIYVDDGKAPAVLEARQGRGSVLNLDRARMGEDRQAEPNRKPPILGTARLSKPMLHFPAFSPV